MKLGFTGTRNAITLPQSAQLPTTFRYLKPTEFHHGDCIGADNAAHTLAVWLDIHPIHIHPPSNPIFRAFCHGDVMHPEFDYLIRNHMIVDQTEHLLAVPNGPEEQRSGTWATVRYARKIGRPVTIIMPNGAIL
jgi:hypothetical protein